MSRLRQFINTTEIKLIYKSIILPHFDYEDVVCQCGNLPIIIVCVNFKKFKIELGELF